MCHQITDDEKISRTLFEIRSGVCGMHGRIVTVHVDPADIDEAVEVYEASVVPAAKSQAGFHGAMLFVDHATGRGVSVTFWESEELMMQGQGSQYYSDQIAKFAALLTRAPEQHGYELVTREIAF
jgi:quinol monooxygenase YgiN